MSVGENRVDTSTTAQVNVIIPFNSHSQRHSGGKLPSNYCHRPSERTGRRPRWRLHQSTNKQPVWEVGLLRGNRLRWRRRHWPHHSRRVLQLIDGMSRPNRPGHTHSCVTFHRVAYRSMQGPCWWSRMSCPTVTLKPRTSKAVNRLSLVSQRLDFSGPPQNPAHPSERP